MPSDTELACHGALIIDAAEPQGQLALPVADELARAGAGTLIVSAQKTPSAPQLPWLHFDTTDEAEWHANAARFEALADHFQIIINVTLPALVGPLRDIDLASFRLHHRRVLHTAFLAVKFGAAAMRRHGHGGSIVNVIGIDHRRPSHGFAAAASTDGGIRLLTKAAALELGPEHIRVNTLQCDINSANPRATPDDIAQAARFLASPRSRFMTGADLVIDGGRLVGA
jgi:NAD(P)-dependent dehydrogenase (short-subunit alcohol dehydrogenase family)